MPRKPSGTWDARRRVWVAQLGPRYTTKDGKRRRSQAVLTDEHGTPIGRWDELGKEAALLRLRAAAAAEDAREAAEGHPGPGVLTVSDLFRRHIAWSQANGLAPSTVLGYREAAKYAANTPHPNRRGLLIGDLEASRFGEDELFAVRQRQRREGLTDTTISSREARILSAFRWAAKAVEGRQPTRLLAVNPFPPGSVVRVPQGRSERPCASWETVQAWLDEAERLAASVPPPNRRLVVATALGVRLCGERGCRPSEVLRLRCEDWRDGERPGFELGKHKTSRHGVVGVIPVSAETAARIRAVIADRPDPVKFPWVVAPEVPASREPGRCRLTRWWGKTRGKIDGAAGYELYSFRNTMSNELRRRGVEGRSLQLALRHTQAVADSVYRRDDLATAAGVFEAAGL